MRLKEVIAEYLYLEDCNHNPYIPFPKQDSNVRDYYFRAASERIPSLMSGYIKQHTNLPRIVNGGLKLFIDAHGGTITKENYGSLTRRIVALIESDTKNHVKSEGYKLRVVSQYENAKIV